MRMVDLPADHDARGVYGISVAAELTDIGVQNIRSYERRGLLEPARTDGGTRRYSNDDLTRLRRIKDLLSDGLNLAGIVLVLQLESENADLRTEIDRQPEPRATADESAAQVLPDASGSRSASSRTAHQG